MYTDSVKNVDSPSVFNPPEYCLSANNLLPLGHGLTRRHLQRDDLAGHGGDDRAVAATVAAIGQAKELKS